MTQKREIWDSKDSDDNFKTVLEPVEEGIYLIAFYRQEVTGHLLSHVEELLKHGRDAIKQDKQLSAADKAGAVALQFTIPSSKIYRVPNNVKIKSRKLTAKLVDKLQPVQEGNYVIQLTPKDMEKFHGDLKKFLRSKQELLPWFISHNDLRRLRMIGL